MRFSNATELLVEIFAIRQSLIEVVKASLAGSIICNLLLVLGIAIFVGGVQHKTQSFNRSAAHASASTLFLAVIAMAMPAIFFQKAPPILGKVTTQSLTLLVPSL